MVIVRLPLSNYVKKLSLSPAVKWVPLLDVSARLVTSEEREALLFGGSNGRTHARAPTAHHEVLTYLRLPMVIIGRLMFRAERSLSFVQCPIVRSLLNIVSSALLSA